MKARQTNSTPTQLPSQTQLTDEPAFQGLAGDIVRAIEPHSEADPLGLLVTLLVAFGNAVGPAPHFIVEGDRHGANLFCVLVGQTAKARKGTAWGQVKKLVGGADENWSTNCIRTGLSSGEGLIHAVRDPAGHDAGISDKRLLVVESEFGSALRILSRTGNILSPTLRQAWDGNPLCVLSRNTAAKATGAHISLIGHITHDELTNHLRDSEVFSGLVNRILWVSVTRSKVLPEGGTLPQSEFRNLQSRLRKALAKAKGVNEIRFSEKGRRYWAEIYEALGQNGLGLFGAATSRAEALVRRLSMLFALMDQTPDIWKRHIVAAESVWSHCRVSARSAFQEKTSRNASVADRLLALFNGNPTGLSTSEISAGMCNHVRSEQLRRLLEDCEKDGVLRRSKRVTGGRPAEFWTLVLPEESQ